VRDPDGDAVTDPCRVRVPVRSPHPREITAVEGGDFAGQSANESCIGRITMRVERMGLRAGL
jgi:hypothetical protein